MTDSGILHGLKVLDLSWGISGPMTGMLLADHGAQVTRIEPPAGDPFAELSGSRVWLRGKRRATLDLQDAADRDVFKALARDADVVIESFAPGVAASLGIDHETLMAENPRLVHCSITGYGESGRHSDRPAYDALVAARTGQMFESRGVLGTTIGRLSGTEVMPGYEAPPGCSVGADRDGPLFGGLPWVSVATFYNASVAINAALLAREITGRGQHVHTSMLQGVLATTLGAWQRAENADREGFNSWIFDPRAPKACSRVRTARGPITGFRCRASSSVLASSNRSTVTPNSRRRVTHPCASRRPSTTWSSCTPTTTRCVRPSPSSRARTGPSSQLESVSRCRSCGHRRMPFSIRCCSRTAGSSRSTASAWSGARISSRRRRPHDPRCRGARRAHRAGAGRSSCGARDQRLRAAVRAGAQGAARRHRRARSRPGGGRSLRHPAAGGPGRRPSSRSTRSTTATGISNHIAICCNRGKRSIAINLKDPQGMDVLRKLVQTGRRGAAQHALRRGRAAGRRLRDA